MVHVAEEQNSEERLIQRARITIRGAVQGVGFRPFVHRLAVELCLSGLACNSPQGVAIEVEGEKPRLDEFLLRLEQQPPPRAFIINIPAMIREKTVCTTAPPMAAAAPTSQSHVLRFTSARNACIPCRSRCNLAMSAGPLKT